MGNGNKDKSIIEMLPPWARPYAQAFLDGFFTPVWEAIFATLFFALASIPLGLGTPSVGSIVLTIAVLSVGMVLINVAVYLVLGFKNTIYGMLFIIGAILGLKYFGPAIANLLSGQIHVKVIVWLYIISALVGIAARFVLEYKRKQGFGPDPILG